MHLLVNVLIIIAGRVRLTKHTHTKLKVQKLTAEGLNFIQAYVLYKQQRYVTTVKTVNQLNKKMMYNHMIFLPKDHRDDCT